MKYYKFPAVKTATTLKKVVTSRQF